MDWKGIVIVVFVIFSVVGTIVSVILGYTKKEEKLRCYRAAENIIKEKYLSKSLMNPNIENVDISEIYNTRMMVYIKNISVKPKRGYVFDVSDMVRIGRKNDCNIILNDSTVSSEHCIIYNMDNNVCLQDKSLNGTLLKRGIYRLRIVDNTCVLEDGDTLVIGSTEFKIRLFVYDGRNM